MSDQTSYELVLAPNVVAQIIRVSPCLFGYYVFFTPSIDILQKYPEKLEELKKLAKQFLEAQPFWSSTWEAKYLEDEYCQCFRFEIITKP